MATTGTTENAVPGATTAGLAKASEIKPKLDVVVVLTDGYTPWPAKSPQYKTVIVVTGKDGAEGTPKWARTLVAD